MSIIPMIMLMTPYWLLFIKSGLARVVVIKEAATGKRIRPKMSSIIVSMNFLVYFAVLSHLKESITFRFKRLFQGSEVAPEPLLHHDERHDDGPHRARVPREV